MPQVRGCRNERGARTVSSANIQQRAAPGRDFGYDQPIDGVEVRLALLR
jgi:hypothetical protein